MIAGVRRHASYANVAATLALVFAMSGGAFAASHYLISSTKQISPKVLTALRGKRGPSGATGAVGTPGANGTNGANGKDGTNGQNGTPGQSVSASEVALGVGACAGQGGSEFKAGATTTFACNGKEGAEGQQGSPWTAGGTLPSGASEKGQWALSDVTAATGEERIVPLSFPIPLAATIAGAQAHFIAAGATVPHGCLGTVEAPQAEPGFLCVFETGGAAAPNNAEFSFFFNAEKNRSEVGKTGVLMRFKAPLEGKTAAVGTWAVTAP